MINVDTKRRRKKKTDLIKNALHAGWWQHYLQSIDRIVFDSVRATVYIMIGSEFEWQMVFRPWE